MSAASPPDLGVGLLGYGFMGRAHSHALKTMPYMMWPPPAVPRLVAICGRDAGAVEQARERYGFARAYTAWRRLVNDPEIAVFANLSPNNLHAEPCIAAANAGQHVLCEKPLARSGEEALAMLRAVETAGVQHMVGFNYRFVPALRLAHDLIQQGRLGRIYHFRAVYLQSRIAQPDAPMTWRLRREVAGSGALGDLGSHALDLARWLAGEIGAVNAITRTFIAERPVASGSAEREAVTVDDAVATLLEFESGALGTLEATRFATGRKNHLAIEINGSDGAIAFDLERLNELLLYSNDDAPDVRGFHTIHVSENHHPFYRFWWPRGHSIGWEHTFVHEIYHFFRAIVGEDSVAPHGATFLDGYRAAVVSDAVALAAAEQRHIPITYAAP